MKTNLDSAQLYDKTIHADWITEPVTDTQYRIEEDDSSITVTFQGSSRRKSL